MHFGIEIISAPMPVSGTACVTVLWETRKVKEARLNQKHVRGPLSLFSSSSVWCFSVCACSFSRLCVQSGRHKSTTPLPPSRYCCKPPASLLPLLPLSSPQWARAALYITSLYPPYVKSAGGGVVVCGGV